MRNSLIAFFLLIPSLAFGFPNTLKEGDVEVYSVDLGGGKHKTFYYVYDKAVSPGMAIARAGYAGKYITYIDLITIDELNHRLQVKEAALRKIGLTAEEYEALNES